MGRIKGELNGRRLSTAHGRKSKSNFTGDLQTGTSAPLHAKFGPAP
jgi:hypothetical protein